MHLLEYEFFKELNTEEQQMIVDASRPVALPIGSILYYEGDVCEEMLFLSGERSRSISPRRASARGK